MTCKFTYPQEYIDRVKAAFPDVPNLFPLLDTGSEHVKQFVEGTWGNLQPTEYLKARESGDYTALDKEAHMSIERRSIHDECHRLWDEFRTYGPDNLPQTTEHKQTVAHPSQSNVPIEVLGTMVDHGFFNDGDYKEEFFRGDWLVCNASKQIRIIPFGDQHKHFNFS